jgi:DNA-directed RNA polymerase subunit beta'
MSTNNILSPANGKPIIVPSQDIVLGLYHLSYERTDLVGAKMAVPSQEALEFGLRHGGLVVRDPDHMMKEPDLDDLDDVWKKMKSGKLQAHRVPFYGDVAEIEHGLAAKAIHLHTRIRSIYRTVDGDGKPIEQKVATTAGRMLLSQVLPKSPQIPFKLINQVLTKKEISNVIDAVYRHCGQKETVIFADRVMGLGFSYACRAGISFGKDDLKIPPAKEKLILETQAKIKDYEQQYQDGLITQGEKYNKVVDAWTACTDRVADAMMKEMQAIKPGEPLNPVYMMAHSGARGSPAQIKQLAGMRGLMAKPSGEIIETPIISNFKEGLTVLEYFNSTHGARKGLADTALKTANSGYLTRRLVDVAQDCIITEDDCGTEDGIRIGSIVEGGELVVSLAERVLGRTAAEDIVDPADKGRVLVAAGEMIDEAGAERIDQAGIDFVRIRSVLTCRTKVGVCGKCYGRDLARGTKVNVGEAVGVIAAQSIGEPGTQLTMRTFHIGGAAQRGAEQSTIEASLDAVISIANRNVVKNSDGKLVAMSRNLELILKDDAGRERARHRVPYGAKLSVDDGSGVTKGERLAEWDPYTIPILTERAGRVEYVDLVEGTSMREVMDEATGISSKVVVDWRQQARGGDLRPRIQIKDAAGNVLILPNGAEARYFLSVDAILSVENGAEVRAGDELARIPRETSKTRDITGGLPRVAELFEARRPKDHAIIAESAGRVEFGKDYKAKRRIVIRPEDGEPKEYLIPKGKHITVQEGDIIEKGDLLMSGNPVPHDILAVKGVEALAEYLIKEIQEVYRLQGVKINDKHIEVIIRQMMQKVEITEPGDTTFLTGEQVDRDEFDEVNAKAVREELKPADARPVLQGITKASLQTKSFVSAASFQETTRVLTEAAVNGKRDDLNGLKENVIVGRLIPAGTGSVMKRLRHDAMERDQKLIAQRKAKEAQELEKAVAGGR